MGRWSKISGVGSYVPPKVVTNDDLSKIMETNDEWIVQRTGINQRHWAESDVGTSDLALEASSKAIAQAGLQNSDIDGIIFATLSPDHDFPGSACFLQAKLGLPGIMALDIRQQCTGFLYALNTADLYVKSGQYNHILVVGAEIHSKGLDRTTKGRDVAVLFGDGAGAVVVSATNEENGGRLMDFRLHADGSYAKELWLPAPGTGMGSPNRLDLAMLEEGTHYPQMNGKTVFVHAVKKMAETLTDLLKSNSKSLEDIDLFLFHQANLRINSKVAEILQIPEEKVFNTIQDYGNTTAATIPLGLDRAMEAGVAKPGMLIASAAFGSGFTWASGLWKL
jgi:3-oxoacyl-[acyl-carrier-protein] synthase III